MINRRGHPGLCSLLGWMTSCAVSPLASHSLPGGGGVTAGKEEDFGVERYITLCLGRKTGSAAQLGDQIRSSGEKHENQSLDVKFRCVQSSLTDAADS